MVPGTEVSVGGFEVALILIAFVALAYVVGVIPSPGLVKIYYKIRLAALLWTGLVVIFAANRLFHFV